MLFLDFLFLFGLFLFPALGFCLSASFPRLFFWGMIMLLSALVGVAALDWEQNFSMGICPMAHRRLDPLLARAQQMWRRIPVHTQP